MCSVKRNGRRASWLAVALLTICQGSGYARNAAAQEQAQSKTLVKTLKKTLEKPWPVVFTEDFESGDKRWRPLDPTGWKIKDVPGGHVYSQFKKEGGYKPPHRSPVNIALLQEVTVGDFELTVKVLSTHPDYGHRDAVLIFGYQDPAHFYYVHLGKQADDHANQIFIVNEMPRAKISLTSTTGTPWDEKWHTVRIVRRLSDKSITVYFDDMQKPVMTAVDDTFRSGRFGLGSFDDTTDWDDLRISGVVVGKP